MENKIKEIAKKVLNLRTLETRNSDSLDFHDLSAWQIKKALELAFKAGKKEAKTELKFRHVSKIKGS